MQNSIPGLSRVEERHGGRGGGGDGDDDLRSRLQQHGLGILDFGNVNFAASAAPRVDATGQPGGEGATADFVGFDVRASELLDLRASSLREKVLASQQREGGVFWNIGGPSLNDMSMDQSRVHGSVFDSMVQGAGERGVVHVKVSELKLATWASEAPAYIEVRCQPHGSIGVISGAQIATARRVPNQAASRDSKRISTSSLRDSKRISTSSLSQQQQHMGGIGIEAATFDAVAVEGAPLRGSVEVVVKGEKGAEMAATTIMMSENHLGQGAETAAVFVLEGKHGLSGGEAIVHIRFESMPAFNGGRASVSDLPGMVLGTGGPEDRILLPRTMRELGDAMKEWAAREEVKSEKHKDWMVRSKFETAEERRIRREQEELAQIREMREARVRTSEDLARLDREEAAAEAERLRMMREKSRNIPPPQAYPVNGSVPGGIETRPAALGKAHYMPPNTQHLEGGSMSMAEDVFGNVASQPAGAHLKPEKPVAIVPASSLSNKQPNPRSVESRLAEVDEGRAMKRWFKDHARDGGYEAQNHQLGLEMAPGAREALAELKKAGFRPMLVGTAPPWLASMCVRALKVAGVVGRVSTGECSVSEDEVMWCLESKETEQFARMISGVTAVISSEWNVSRDVSRHGWGGCDALLVNPDSDSRRSFQEFSVPFEAAGRDFRSLVDQLGLTQESIIGLQQGSDSNRNDDDLHSERTRLHIETLTSRFGILASQIEDIEQEVSRLPRSAICLQDATLMDAASHILGHKPSQNVSSVPSQRPASQFVDIGSKENKEGSAVGGKEVLVWARQALGMEGGSSGGGSEEEEQRRQLAQSLLNLRFARKGADGRVVDSSDRSGGPLGEYAFYPLEADGFPLSLASAEEAGMATMVRSRRNAFETMVKSTAWDKDTSMGIDFGESRGEMCISRVVPLSSGWRSSQLKQVWQQGWLLAKVNGLDVTSMGMDDKKAVLMDGVRSASASEAEVGNATSMCRRIRLATLRRATTRNGIPLAARELASLGFSFVPEVGALRCCECGQDLVGVFDPEEVKEAHVSMSPSCSIARGGQAPDVGGTPKGAYNVRGTLILGWVPPAGKEAGVVARTLVSPERNLVMPEGSNGRVIVSIERLVLNLVSSARP